MKGSMDTLEAEGPSRDGDRPDWSPVGPVGPVEQACADTQEAGGPSGKDVRHRRRRRVFHTRAGGAELGVGTTEENRRPCRLRVCYRYNSRDVTD